MEAAVLELNGIRKNYAGLRPLRIRSLTLGRGERVAVLGFDAAAAELLVNLITGATLPDDGDVRVMGQRTAEITSGDDWLSSLDRFGIVSERAVMIEGATLEQNLAMPFTLEIDPVPPETRAQVHTLATECGIGGASEWLPRPAAEAPPEVRVRAHLARAIALNPVLLVLEHPTATVAEPARAPLADDISRVTSARNLTMLAISQDEAFATRVAQRALKLNGATGELAPLRKKWFW